MNDVLKGLEPSSVFRHFEALTRIPRGSGHERAVSDYLVKFAQDLNLEVLQDESLNVIIKKSGTLGYESAKRVILQGHMDMVCVKNDDFDFDFTRDPIPLVVSDDVVKTKGTTLGADNGIAVAMAMAILESNDLPHPPLTVLITVEEETGMFGVKHLNGKDIEGDVLINLDSEEEGIFLASCAGGVRAVVSLPIEYKEGNFDHDAYELSITGLLGGHSGMEINKGRANAVVLLGRLLAKLEEELAIDISYLVGGEKMNAIAKFAKSKISLSPDKVDNLRALINDLQQTFSNEFQATDPKITITMKKVENSNMVFSELTKGKLIHLLRLFPNGVQSMSGSMEALVESSLNIGVLEMEDDYVVMSGAIRSSVKSRKYEIADRIKSLCELTGATIKCVGDYPEWQYEVVSPIRDLMLKVYQEMFGKEGEVQAIHAGLECGYLKEKLGNIDMISLGPNITGAHTPLESLSISSTKRVYEFVCEVLKQMK